MVCRQQMMAQAIGHRAVNALPHPGDAVHLVIGHQPSLPQPFKPPSRLPLQKIPVNRAGTPKPLLGQRFPWDARAADVDNPGKDLSGGQRFPSAPRFPVILPIRVPLRLGNQRLHFCHKASQTSHEAMCCVGFGFIPDITQQSSILVNHYLWIYSKHHVPRTTYHVSRITYFSKSLEIC